MRLRYGTGSPCDIANQPNSPISSSGTPAGQPPIRIRTAAEDWTLNLIAEVTEEHGIRRQCGWALVNDPEGSRASAGRDHDAS